MIFQLNMQALRAEPVAEGETPPSSVQVVSKVLSQNSSHHFLKSVGIKTPTSSKSSSSKESELREELAAEAAAAVQVELDELKKKMKKLWKSRRGHKWSWRSTRSKQRRTPKSWRRTMLS